MKKLMRKIALLLAGCCLIGTLSGCGGVDFSAYLKALLDSHYLNDSTDYVELGIGTAEETGSAPSGDEMADQMFKLQLECMDAAMSQLTYGEPAEFVIRVEWSEEEQLWIPNVDQYIELEYCLLDYENMRLSY